MAEAIDRDSFVWTSTGVKPAQGDEVYEAGDQPIAEYDNWFMWAVTSDIKSLSETIGSHAEKHEAGGSDEIDLSGLEIGSGGGVDSPTQDQIDILSQSDTTAARLDTAAEEWLEFPAVNDTLEAAQGITLTGGSLDVNGSDIQDANTGTTIYSAASGSIPASAVEDAFIRKSGGGLQQDLDVNGYDLNDVSTILFTGSGVDGADAQLRFDSSKTGFSVYDIDTGEAPLSVQAESVNFRRNIHLVDSDGRIVGDSGDIHMGGDTIGFTHTVDFMNHEAQNFRVENRTSDPSNPSTGRIWIRTDL